MFNFYTFTFAFTCLCSFRSEDGHADGKHPSLRGSSIRAFGGSKGKRMVHTVNTIASTGMDERVGGWGWNRPGNSNGNSNSNSIAV